MKKRGQANIVVVVLLILIVIAAVVVIANVLMSVVKKGTEQVGIGAFTTQIEIKEATISIGGDISVSVHLGSGGEELSELKLFFEDAAGNIHTETITTNLPGEIETKTYPFLASDLGITEKITKVSAVPMFDGKAGIETVKDAYDNGKEGVYYNNLIDDIDFQSSFWSPGKPTIGASDTIENPDGIIDRGVHVTGNVAPNNWAIMESDDIILNPTKAYKFSIWVKATNPSKQNLFGVRSGAGTNHFKTTGDSNSWNKLIAYVYARSLNEDIGPFDDCNLELTSLEDYCIGETLATIKFRFGNNDNNADHTYFMYPKIEEVDSLPI
jgi:hypothetical protein